MIFKKKFFFIIFMSNIFISIFVFSCSKKEKTNDKFNLNKNIELDIGNLDDINSNIEKITYKFSQQKEIIKYNIKSLQLFTSKFTQVLFKINFDINFRRIKNDNGLFTYKIYFSNFKIKDDIYYGYLYVNSIKKKYNLIINALYFKITIDSYGNKTFYIDNKIGLNPNLKTMAGFIFNLINYIFINLPNYKIKDNNFIIKDKRYELTSNFEKNGSVLLRENLSQKRDFYIYPKKKFILLKSDKNKSKIRILYSNNEGLPIKINLLFENNDKLKFDKKDFTYSIKNYFFIKKVSDNN